MKNYVIVCLLVCIALAVFISPFASCYPDGLERVAEDLQFIHKGESKEIFTSPMPDYTIPSIRHESISTAIAGFVGTLLTFGITLLLGVFVKKR
jgi:cobalt/nickel transport protein